MTGVQPAKPGESQPGGPVRLWTSRYGSILGVGTAVTILVDATLIRVVLLPVTMRLAGRANSWAPRPLRPMRLREDGGTRADVPREEYV